MSDKNKNSNSSPSGKPTNNPGGQGELVKGQVPNMKNPPPPPPTKKD